MLLLPPSPPLPLLPHAVATVTVACPVSPRCRMVEKVHALRRVAAQMAEGAPQAQSSGDSLNKGAAVKRKTGAAQKARKALAAEAFAKQLSGKGAGGLPPKSKSRRLSKLEGGEAAASAAVGTTGRLTSLALPCAPRCTVGTTLFAGCYALEKALFYGFGAATDLSGSWQRVRNRARYRVAISAALPFLLAPRRSTCRAAAVSVVKTQYSVFQPRAPLLR